MTVYKDVEIKLKTNMIARRRVLNFLVATVDEIQKYLDKDSIIRIGDTYPISNAMMMENSIVYEIYQYLTEVYDATFATIFSFPVIQDVVCMLTASEIGFAYFGSSLGNPLTTWAGRLEDRAWRILMRLYIGQELGVTKKNVSFGQRLLRSKTRTRMNRIGLE